MDFFKFLIPKDRLTSSSARIFGLWITVPAIIMVIISSNFFKKSNPTYHCSSKVLQKDLARGEEIEEFKPSGAMQK